MHANLRDANAYCMARPRRRSRFRAPFHFQRPGVTSTAVLFPFVSVHCPNPSPTANQTSPTKCSPFSGRRFHKRPRRVTFRAVANNDNADTRFDNYRVRRNALYFGLSRQLITVYHRSTRTPKTQRTYYIRSTTNSVFYSVNVHYHRRRRQI